jgi:p-hydroxybenzoate 3-monooxygenase
MSATARTQVAIIGAGPAGLLLSHLLADAGIDSIVIDSRERHEIETTIRAGILEQGTVDLLQSSGASDRVVTAGSRHDGIELRFAGEGYRIDFAALVGRSVWLYPQHEVLKDLIAARLAAGQDLRFGVTAQRVEDAQTNRPRVVATTAEMSPLTIDADFVVGADGSRSVARTAVAGPQTGGFFHEYPFAWFGILCEAPPSSDELIYSNSPDGFALISQRSATVQRMYFQCDPSTDASAYSEDQLWAELQKRVPGTTLKKGTHLPTGRSSFPEFRRPPSSERTGRTDRRRGAHGATHRGQRHEPRGRRCSGTGRRPGLPFCRQR